MRICILTVSIAIPHPVPEIVVRTLHLEFIRDGLSQGSDTPSVGHLHIAFGSLIVVGLSSNWPERGTRSGCWVEDTRLGLQRGGMIGRKRANRNVAYA